MYFLLKRFKGAITYLEFYEMWDEDMWALYIKEEKLIEEELKDAPNENSNKTNVPEPNAPEEDENMLALLREFREE